jgi:hypothetical protein
VEQGTPADAVVYATPVAADPWLPVVRICAMTPLVYGVVVAAHRAALVTLAARWMTISELFGGTSFLDYTYSTTGDIAGGSIAPIDTCIALAGLVLAIGGLACWLLSPRGRPLVLAACTALLLFIAAGRAIAIWNILATPFGWDMFSTGDALEDAVNWMAQGVSALQDLLVPSILLALMTRPGARHVLGR